jgi:uncharacterized membrane protein YccC
MAENRMREPLSREATGESPLNEAMRRLDRALAELESNLGERDLPPEAERYRQERRELAQDLEAARARERALEYAAAAASDALGRAAAEVRAALGAGETQDVDEEEAA